MPKQQASRSAEARGKRRAPQTVKPDGRHDALLDLQASAGNQAVSRLVQRTGPDDNEYDNVMGSTKGLDKLGPPAKSQPQSSSQYANKPSPGTVGSDYANRPPSRPRSNDLVKRDDWG